MLSEAPARQVLVVGGGLAGLAAALAMARRGLQVQVIEQLAQWQPSGAGLTLGAASLRALQQLGVLDEVVRRGHVHQGIQVCDVQGRPLRLITSPPLPDAQVPGAGGILRSVLHDILRSALASCGVAVRLGLRVQQLDLQDHAAQVQFSDGSQQRVDLVVGAEGLTSALRQEFFAQAAPPRFTGQGCWRVVLPRPAEIDNRHFFLGGRCKLGLTPVSAQQMYLFLLEHVPDRPWRDAATQHEVLRDLLQGYGGPLAQVREQLGPQSEVVYRPLEAHYLGPSWHRGRLLLIGDAAHATTPQLAAGAGMGLEDGLVLAQELGRAQPLPQALQAFMARRHERCQMVVHNSLRIGELEVQGASPQEQTAVVDASLRQLAQPI